MARLTHLSVVALRDNVFVQTAAKEIKYVQLPGSPLPEGQKLVDTQIHGLTIQKDQEIEIDVRDFQLPYFRACIEKGDIEVVGLPPVEAPAAPAAPAPSATFDLKAKK